MNHVAASAVSDAPPPPGTKWARSNTKRCIWYAMACTQHRRLLSSEGGFFFFFARTPPAV